MKFLVFWYLAIPVMLVAMFIDWGRGIKPVSSLAWAGVIIVAQIAGWIKEKQENTASEKANDAATRCKHGLKTWHSCKGCAEEFAYFETCMLCGLTWDNRHQKHDHKLIPDANGNPQYYINGIKQMMSSSYMYSGYPGYSSSYQRSQCMTIDTTTPKPICDIGPVIPKQQVMKLVITPEEKKNG